MEPPPPRRREPPAEPTAPSGPAAAVSPAHAVGGPVPVAWREGTLTRAKELEALCEWVTAHGGRKDAAILATAIQQHLEAARQAAHAKTLDPKKPVRGFRNGPLIERARSNLDAAECHLLSIAEPAYVLGQMPSLLRHVQSHLRPTDPRRQEFEAIIGRLGIKDPHRAQLAETQLPAHADNLATIAQERRKVVTIVRGASAAGLREHI